MQIQIARSADIDELYRLLAAQFNEHDIATSGSTLRAAINALLKDERLGLLLVAREGDMVVGCAQLSFAWTLEHGGKTAWLDELYVIPERRGRGIGRALLAQVLQVARQHGCKAIDLEVDDNHRQAESLYTRVGFKRLPRSRWALKL